MSLGSDLRIDMDEMFDFLSEAQKFVEKNGVEAFKAYLEKEGITAEVKYDGNNLNISFSPK